MAEGRRIQTRVGTLAVRVMGDGPPAVLWHSLFVDERSWQRVEQDLARDRRLVIITGPGHGTSTDPGHRYTLDDCAAAAAEVLASLGIEDAVDWVGNAWGGHVGIVFAATWPDRCRSLVTLGTPVQAYGASARLTFRLLLAVYRVVGMVGYLASGICDALLSAKTRSSDPEAVALVLDGLRTMRRRDLGNAMESISLGRPDLTPRLGSIRCPTMFVTGTDHPEWTPDLARTSSRLLAFGSVAVVPDAAYLIPLEAPAATIRIVRGHWAASAEPTRSRTDPSAEVAMVRRARPGPSRGSSPGRSAGPG